MTEAFANMAEAAPAFDFESSLSWSDKIIEIRQSIAGKRSRLVMDTTDAQVRAGLIALGWTPPA